MKAERIVILEIGDNFVKGCRVVRSKKKREVGALDFCLYSHRIGAQDISDFFEKFTGKFKYDKVIISLPRQFFLIRFFYLPSLNWKEVEKMLPFQMSKGIIQPVEDVVYDYSLAAKEAGRSKVLVYITQKKKISSALEFIGRVKTLPCAITNTSWGLYQWHSCAALAVKDSLLGPKAVVDVSSSDAEFMIASEEGILFSRAFPYSGDDDLIEGITQSLKIFEKEYGAGSFNKAVFTGIRKDKVIESVSWAQSSFIEQKAGSFLSKDAEEKISAAEVSFASILGLAGGQGYGFDFSPSFLKEKKRNLVRRKKTVLSAVLAAQILFVFCLFLGKYVVSRHAYLDFLNSKLREVNIEVKELGTVTQKLKVLDNELAKSVSFSRALYEVILAVPPSARLALVDFRDKGDFSIKGVVKNNDEVFVIKKALGESELFGSVDVKYVSKVKERRGEEGFEFYMEGKVKQ